MSLRDRVQKWVEKRKQGKTEVPGLTEDAQPRHYIPPWECSKCKTGPNNAVLLCAYHVQHGWPPRNRMERRQSGRPWRARYRRACGLRNGGMP